MNAKARLTPVWEKVTSLFRKYRRARRWRSIEEPVDMSPYDPANPLLFTSPRALADYRAGLFTRWDGSSCSLDDLEWDLKTEVMRMQNWTELELQFHAVLDRLLAQGYIEDTGNYWYRSPHGAVYRIRENVKIRLLGKTFRLRRGRQMAFQCRMSREQRSLTAPFITGSFEAASHSMLCGEMANAMMGTDRKGRSPVPLAPNENETETMQLPPIDLRNVQAEEETRVVYFLIDVSGSMSGRRLEAAKMALLAFLQNISARSDIRVGLRSFNGGIGSLQGSIRKGYGMGVKTLLLRAAEQLNASGTTALFQAVKRALDDLQSLIHLNRAPKAFLILLSDGEDNQGISYSYEGETGEEALFIRMRHFRSAGLLEYFPITYGKDVEALDRIGGPEFHAETTDPKTIIEKFAQIREHVMVGLPALL